MHRFFFVTLLALAACNPSSSPNDDGGNVLSGRLCTTPECADDPCTPGCLFQVKAGGCPCVFPNAIATARVTACANRCGLRYPPSASQSGPTPAGFCSHFDSSQAGCTLPDGGYDIPSACYVNDNEFDEGGAAICAAGETCDDGASLTLADLGNVN
jgi:hypothetical protein